MGVGEKRLLTIAPGKFVNEALAGSTFITPFAVVTAPRIRIRQITIHRHGCTQCQRTTSQGWQVATAK